MSQVQKRKVPVIISDVDGVLKQGFNAMISERIHKGLKIARSTLGKIDPDKYGAEDKQKIPFLLFTNRGAMTEKEHANIMNKVMNFDQGEDQQYAFNESENILNHSALVPQFKLYQNDLVLIVGCGNIESIAIHCGSKKYITVAEYVSLFTYMFPFHCYTEEQLIANKEKIMKRLNLTEDDLKEPFQCHAIFILTMTYFWEITTQLILDLLSTEDGKVAQQMPEIGPSKHIPVFVAYNDTTYKAAFQLPRMVNGCFIASLRQVYKSIYKSDMQIQFYGKPELKQFEFTRDYAISNLDKNHEATNFYMIGDNPLSDIKGANEIGWTSILVRTGVFQGLDNDLVYPATHVVNDFYDAIKLIFELEGISTHLLQEN